MVLQAPFGILEGEVELVMSGSDFHGSRPGNPDFAEDGRAYYMIDARRESLIRFVPMTVDIGAQTPASFFHNGLHDGIADLFP